MEEITSEEVKKMREPCCSVLTLYYWDRKCMDEIATIMNYSNGDVAKNRKSLCIKELRRRVSFRLRAEGITYYKE